MPKRKQLFTFICSVLLIFSFALTLTSCESISADPAKVSFDPTFANDPLTESYSLSLTVSNGAEHTVSDFRCLVRYFAEGGDVLCEQMLSADTEIFPGAVLSFDFEVSSDVAYGELKSLTLVPQDITFSEYVPSEPLPEEPQPGESQYLTSSAGVRAMLLIGIICSSVVLIGAVLIIFGFISDMTVMKYIGTGAVIIGLPLAAVGFLSFAFGNALLFIGICASCVCIATLVAMIMFITWDDEFGTVFFMVAAITMYFAAVFGYAAYFVSARNLILGIAYLVVGAAYIYPLIHSSSERDGSVYPFYYIILGFLMLGIIFLVMPTKGIIAAITVAAFAAFVASNAIIWLNISKLCVSITSGVLGVIASVFVILLSRTDSLYLAFGIIGSMAFILGIMLFAQRIYDHSNYNIMQAIGVPFTVIGFFFVLLGFLEYLTGKPLLCLGIAAIATAVLGFLAYFLNVIYEQHVVSRGSAVTYRFADVSVEGSIALKITGTVSVILFTSLSAVFFILHFMLL